MEEQIKSVELIPLTITSKLSHYTVIPQALYDMDLSMQAIVVYSKLLSRAILSAKAGETDEQGRVYIYYLLEELGQELHISKSTAKKYMRELCAAGLLEKRRAKSSRANVITVMLPCSSIRNPKASRKTAVKYSEWD